MIDFQHRLIVRVQNKDGIDKFGEVTIPEGADVLLLRTVKADGSTREPEEILVDRRWGRSHLLPWARSLEHEGQRR